MLRTNLMLKFILIPFSIFYLTTCKSESKKEAAVVKTHSALLQKTLTYHDAKQNWHNFKSRLYLSSADTTGKAKAFTIEIDNATGYFAHVSRKDGKEIIKGVAHGTGEKFYLLDGKTDISAAKRKK